MGCPSTAIAMEELVKVGCGYIYSRRYFRCNATRDESWVILRLSHAAIRDEGTTRQYLPIEYPAVADLEVTNALVTGTQKIRISIVCRCFTHERFFYSEVEPDTDANGWLFA